MQFGKSTYIFRISQEFQWYQYLRDIADIHMFRIVKLRKFRYLNDENKKKYITIQIYT